MMPAGVMIGAATAPAIRTTGRSAPSAGLPDFIVIGAMRAGTTTLHRLLAAHSLVAMSREKEPDFFVAERNFDRGLNWYRGLFPRDGAVRGEASPNYTKCDIFPGVPERISAHLPDVRLIYVLRDPVERLLSHYRFAAAMGRSVDAGAFAHMVTTSRYALQLERFRDHFASERILVVDFDELRADPLSVLRRIGIFVGVPDGWEASIRAGTAEAANAGGELVRMPRWFFRFRKLRAVSDLRRRLPAQWTDRIRRVVAAGPAREVPRLGPEAVARATDMLRPDAEALRGMTGLAFASWSV